MPINLPTIPSIAVFLCSALLAFGYAAPATAGAPVKGDYFHIAAKPTAAFDDKWERYVIDSKFFTKLVYDGL
jgi:hypothetical protein